MSSSSIQEPTSFRKSLGVLLFSFAGHALLAASVLVFVTTHRRTVEQDPDRVAILNIAKPYRLPPDQLSPDNGSEEETEPGSPHVDFPAVGEVKFQDATPTSTAVGPSTSPSGTGRTPAGTGRGIPIAFPEVAAARSVVFVIDRSSSMGLNGALGIARRLMSTTLEELPEGMNFQVLAYNQQVVPLRVGVSAGLLPANRAVIAEAKRQVEAITATGKTNHAEGILRALLHRPECLYVITDELKLTWEEVKQITQRNTQRTCIHILEVKGRAGQTDPLVELLVRNNRGSVRKLKEDEEVLFSARMPFE